MHLYVALLISQHDIILYVRASFFIRALLCSIRNRKSIASLYSLKSYIQIWCCFFTLTIELFGEILIPICDCCKQNVAWKYFHSMNSVMFHIKWPFYHTHF